MKRCKTHRWLVLSLSTLAFTLNFSIWTMFSIIGIEIKQNYALTEFQFSLLIALPILSGALTRLPLGILADVFGGEKVFIWQMLLLTVPLMLLSFADQYWQFLLLGSLIGISGGAFAIGVSCVSNAFKKKNQGFALGVLGAGNIGMAITNIMVPIIIVYFSWRHVPVVFSCLLILCSIIFWLTPVINTQKSIGNQTYLAILLAQLSVLNNRIVWKYSFYYFFTFGGFVGLATWLPFYYMENYQLDMISASFITIAFTLPSGLIRIAGGWWSDKVNPAVLTLLVFKAAILCLFMLVFIQNLSMVVFTSIIFTLGFFLGIGKASVFTALRYYFPDNMGACGGCVGMMGGLGGFILPLLFSATNEFFNSSRFCFTLLLIIAILGVLLMVKSRYKLTDLFLTLKVER